jgi:cell division protein FtsQ
MSDYAARHSRANGLVRRSRATLNADRATLEPDRLLSAFLIAAASLALIVVGVLLIPPTLRITRYEISGNAAMTREDVLSAALIHDREYFFALDVDRVKAALAADPRVASATVSKLFPNGLKIALKERRAVAASLVALNGRSSAVCIDSEGVAFAEAGQDAAISVPVLSGIRFEGFRLGTRLPSSLARLMASLGEIQAREPELLAAVSEIRVVTADPPATDIGSADAATTELLIYPLNHRIPVRAGPSLDASMLRSIILVLDVLGTRGIAASVQEIDFRTGTVVYRSKEGQTG